MDEDWKQAWQPLIDAVGTDFGGDAEVWGADEVEKGIIRRFLEPLEFDCPLHYDEGTAQNYGYRNILAPYSSVLSLAIPPLWSPGKQIWTSAERNAQPAYSPVASSSNEAMQKLVPRTPGFFATDIEIDYLQPVVVGDRVRMRGRKLISCEPKETRVGRGAFIVWESEILNQRGEPVARMRTGMYQYFPHAYKATKE
jgi:MaoC dehydratase-like protein